MSRVRKKHGSSIHWFITQMLTEFEVDSRSSECNLHLLLGLQRSKYQSYHLVPGAHINRKIQMVTEPKHILLTWDAGIPRYILTAMPNAHPRFYAITTEVIYLLIPFVVIKFLKYPHAKLLLFPLICSAAPKFMIQDIR